MKIGVLIDRLNVGGVEKIAIEEVRALRSIGEDASLVVLRKKAVVENSFPDLLKDTPIIYLDERLPAILRGSFRFPIVSFFSLFHITYPLLLPFVVKKNEFDYFIVHGTYTSLSAVALQRRCNIPFSAFVWDPVAYIVERVYSSKLPRFTQKLFKKFAVAFDTYLLRRMRSVFVGGTAHNEYITSRIPGKTIFTIYPSVHPAKKLLKKDPYVLVITAWKEGKNPEYLFEIVKTVPDIHIKMAGKWVDPIYREKFEQELKASGLESSIEIIGGVSEEELCVLYGKASVLLQTNDDRGFGMPAIEAASQGTTFIIPEGQGVCDLFTDGHHGFYTKEKDTDQITTHLKKLLNDSSLAKDMGTTAWQQVVNNYSWAQHANLLKTSIQLTLSRTQKL